MVNFVLKYKLCLLSMYSPENHSSCSNLAYHIVTFYVIHSTNVIALGFAHCCRSCVVLTLKY